PSRACPSARAAASSGCTAIAARGRAPAATWPSFGVAEIARPGAAAEAARVAAEGAQLAAGAADLVPPPPPHRGDQPALAQARLELLDPRLVGRHHPLAQDRIGIDRDQVDLGLQRAEQ